MAALPVTAGLVSHYDASTLVGFVDTDPVDEIPNLVVGGADLLQANPALQGTFTANISAFGGLPAVLLDGTEWYRGTGVTPINEHTIFIVVRPTQIPGSSFDWRGFFKYCDWYFQTAAGVYEFFGTSTQRHVYISDWCATAIRRQAAAARLYKDGITIVNAAPAAPVGVGTDVLLGGRSWDGVNVNHRSGCYFGEMVVYNRDLSDAEMDEVFTYLKAKWTDAFTDVVEDFSSYAAGALPAGWNTYFPEGATAVTAAIIADGTATGGKALQITGATAGNTNFRMIHWSNVPSAEKQIIHARVRRDDVNGNAWILLRQHGPNINGISVGLTVAGSVVKLAYLRNAAFNLTATAQVDFPNVAGTWAEIIIEIIDNTLRAKAWNDGDVEPVGWMLENLALPMNDFPTRGYVGFGTYTANGFGSLDYINAVLAEPTAPEQPTLTAVVDVDSNTDLTGSVYDGGNPFAESILTIRTMADQTILVDQLTTPVTAWNYPAGTLPYGMLLEAQIIYVDDQGLESLPSEWVAFVIPDPDPLPLTACDTILPVFEDEAVGGSRGECGGIPPSFEPCS